ncbi:RNase A-like domain-containing protein [Luteimonas salinilitoris]|uniref:RNase A-like domain-containing protein n=1 Tax=Luteimonas salinilitoris TaxID=3237697 RepID=A0ABV4HPK9_9GAMM
MHALEAAAVDTDLPQHISDLAERGELTSFLTQTDTAVALAESAPVFAGQLDPLLDRIRDGLSQLPVERLPAVERDAVAATLERLDAHLGPVDGPAPGGEVPGGGLQAHEDAGGHLIERHVGKSEQALVDRVRSENISAASSFRDLPEAEHFVAATLAEHDDRIDAWLGGEGGNRLVVDARFDASTGLSVARGESRAEDVFSVRLVLERSDRLDIGYRIVTGYPSAP